jgi:hypothetical protein
VPDADDQHDKAPVADLVEHPVVADSDAPDPVFATFSETDGAMGSRLDLEAAQRSDDATLRSDWKAVEGAS